MTLEEFRPFGDRVLVRPDAMPTVSESGLIAYPQIVTADNPNHFTMTGRIVKLGDGIREDVYRCHNQQCRATSRRQVGERCPRCSASMSLEAVEERRPFDVKVGDRVVFNRFAGKEVEISPGWDVVMNDYLKPERFFLMREVEIMGVGSELSRVGPVYEEPSFGKVTKGLRPDVAIPPRY